MTEKYRIEGDYLVTNNHDIIFCFSYEKAGWDRFPDSCPTITGKDYLDNEDNWGYKLRFSRSQVREALKPVEGQAFLFVGWGYDKTRSPVYSHRRLSNRVPENGFMVAVNALTIGLTCGEIRKLIEWSKT